MSNQENPPSDGPLNYGIVPLGTYQLELNSRGRRVALELWHHSRRKWRATMKRRQLNLLLDGILKALEAKQEASTDADR